MTAGEATRVVVVGDVMVDVVVSVRGPIARGSDTPSAVVTAPGGAAANVATWLARQGVPTSLVAAVGDDPLGAAATRALRALGVDVTGVVTVARSTGTLVALVNADGERSMLTDRGANFSLRVDAVRRGLAALGPQDHVHVSGYTLLDADTRAAGLEALSLAAAATASRSLDASSAGPLAALGPSRFVGWAQGADLLFCNRDEATLLTGCTSARTAATALAADVVGEAVVTDGASGAVVASAGTVTVVPAVVTTATDTTGAGDAFTGTYLGCRLAGEDVATAGAAASAAAASVVVTPGARTWPA